MAGREVPALIRTTCAISDVRCQVGGLNVEPRSALPLFLDGERPIRFVVSDAASDGPTQLVTLEATFLVPDGTTVTVRAGDRARRDALLGDRAPVLVSTTGARRRSANVGMNMATGSGGGDELSFQLADNAARGGDYLRQGLEAERLFM